MTMDDGMTIGDRPLGTEMVGDGRLTYIECDFTNKDLNLTILMEECAEVIQVCSKIKRFGISAYKKASLTQEFGDIFFMMDKVQKDCGIRTIDIVEAAEKKRVKLGAWYDEE